MIGKKLLAIMAVLMFFSYALAANPTVVVLTGDTNYFYPSRAATVTVDFTVSDADDPGDVNIWVSTVLDPIGGKGAKTQISENVDANLTNFCSDRVVAAAVNCAFTWTPPTGTDANYSFDVNVMDISTGDDLNAQGGNVQVDYNACDSSYTIVNDLIALNTTCKGYGADENGGTEVISYSRSRQGSCSGSYGTYTAPFKVTFGEHTVCFYSADGIGNTETVVGFTHTASSNAYNLALLTELALAALLLITIAGYLAYAGRLTPEIMIGLVSAAVVIVIAVLIFGTIL